MVKKLKIRIGAVMFIPGWNVYYQLSCIFFWLQIFSRPHLFRVEAWTVCEIFFSCRPFCESKLSKSTLPSRRNVAEFPPWCRGVVPRVQNLHRNFNCPWCRSQALVGLVLLKCNFLVQKTTMFFPLLTVQRYIVTLSSSHFKKEFGPVFD